MSTLARQQSGFSLIELMIAMTLGLILTVIIGNVFVGAKESYRTTEDLSRLQENARFAVTHLGRVIRMTSYVSNPANIAATRARWQRSGSWQSWSSRSCCRIRTCCEWLR